jgi:hypothetical protein
MRVSPTSEIRRHYGNCSELPAARPAIDNASNIWTQRQAGAANLPLQGTGFASFLLGYERNHQHTFPIATASS